MEQTNKITFLSLTFAMCVCSISSSSLAEGLKDHYVEIAATQLNGGNSHDNTHGFYVRGRADIYDHFYVDGSFEDAEYSQTEYEERRYGDSFKQTLQLGGGAQVKPTKYSALYAGISYGYTNLNYRDDSDSYASSYLHTGVRILFFNKFEVFSERFSAIDESEHSISTIGGRFQAHANHGYFIEYSTSSNNDRAIDVGVQFFF